VQLYVVACDNLIHNERDFSAGTEQRLAADLGERGVRDASASWVVTEIAGEFGGWVRHSVKVKIAAKRRPEWGLG
jgi:hypothetical protein